MNSDNGEQSYTYENVYIAQMELEWDEPKRQWTLQRRGLDFADAGLVFEGATFSYIDDSKDYGEERTVCFGLLRERLIATVYTDRGDRRRIISMRKANKREQREFFKQALGT